MVKFFEKSNKKHYICSIFAVILTCLFLFSTFSYWCENIFVVSFTSAADKEIKYQFFYKTKPNKHFKESYSEKITVSPSKHVVNIPFFSSKLAGFKLNFGTIPEKVEISNFKIVGWKEFEPKFDDFHYNNQIDSHSVQNGTLTILSSQQNPAMVYNKKINLLPKINIDWCVLAIFSILSYLFFVKLLKYLVNMKELQKASRIDIVMMAVFFVMLCIPISNVSEDEKSIQEMRVLAPAPEFLQKGKINKEFGTQFENWFNDRFWGRNTFININDQIKYFIVPSRGNDKVVIGRKGWLFYKLDDGINNFTNNKILPELRLKEGLNYLVAIDEWCKQHGKEFYYVIAPDKSKIYGEYYNSFIHKTNPDSMGIGQQFTDYIRKHSNVKVLYLYDVLKQNKDKGILYYKHDTHWNRFGGYFGYKLLMETMGFEPKNYKFKMGKYKGDMENMIKTNPDETLYKDPNLDFNTYCKEENKKIFCENAKGHKNIFMLRDSYAKVLLLYLSNDFNKIYTYHYRDHPLSSKDFDLIDNEIDIVILENVERYVPWILLHQKFPKSLKEN